jgi:hypothetical protein
MNWLKDNVYLAAWLALPITVLVAFIQNKKAETKAESFPLKKSLAYLLFLICFPMSLTPALQEANRTFVGVVAVAMLATILIVPESGWHK